jgi:signal transduction histidine kinase
MLQARDAAEAANRSKAEFLANMSHEIRPPMNAILGLTYLLEQAHLDPDSHGMVRKIRTSGRMLLGIINDILDVSKIGAGHLEIERAPFRLDEIIGNVAVSMGIATGDKTSS